MDVVRRWSVRHARLLEMVFQIFEAVLKMLHPLWARIGYERVEVAARIVERRVKHLLFNCQMCGHCLLGSTGMSCPMNCPKELRNGPCGGVREDGGCEVIPDMRCVWVDAWEGSRRMRDGSGMLVVQAALANTVRGRSSWMREVRITRVDELRLDEANG